MNNKNEPEEVELKTSQFNENNNYINIKKCKNVIINSLIISLLIIVLFF